MPAATKEGVGRGRCSVNGRRPDDPGGKDRRRLGASSTFIMLTPLMLPPGRARLLTRPSRIGSKPVHDRYGGGRRLGRQAAGPLPT